MGDLSPANLQNGGSSNSLKVLIIGCGLGGLSCAISCLKEGLEVEILERAKEIGEVYWHIPEYLSPDTQSSSQIGAGIQVPPNASRVLDHYGILQKVESAGAILLEQRLALFYKDGSILIGSGDPPSMKREFGHYWYNIHRVEYHQVLLDEANRLGAKIHLDCEVIDVHTEYPSVTLSSGKIHAADAVIGADGLRSCVRDYVLGYHVDPEPTGDMAYRVTIPRERIEQLNDPYWTSALDKNISRNWWGPDSHAVFYPVRNKTVWNVVLTRPDDLPAGTMTAMADVTEMKRWFEGWDPKLTTLLQCVNSCLKWKICHMSELETWARGSVALLGDACHPTLPYQAQGAAMAVEDGAALGILLGRLSQSRLPNRKARVPDVLQLYEGMRKNRTTLNVQGAIENRDLFQMADPERVEQRNAEMRAADLTDINNDCKWGYANLRYQKQLMGFDTIRDANKQFQSWLEQAK